MAKDLRIHLRETQKLKLEKATGAARTISPDDNPGSAEAADPGFSADIGDETLRGSGGRLAGPLKAPPKSSGSR